MTLEAMTQDSKLGQRAAKKVLIVEDNELNMKLFNDLLEAHGYFTLQTKDGVEALRMARQHRPDLIGHGSGDGAGRHLRSERTRHGDHQ